MNRASTTHASHDELLIARLYGDDLDERERARALAQLDACQACAALLADLGTIARQTAALPTPPRPRDFSLTAADAARLGRPRRSWTRLLALPRARALGGSLVTIGFAGMAILGTITMLAPAGTPASGGYAAQEDGRKGPYSEQPSSPTNVMDGGSKTSGKGQCGDTSLQPAMACPTAGESYPVEYDHQSAGPSATPSCCPSGTPTSNEGAISNPPSPGGGQGAGLDPRLIGLAGFATLAGLGLVLLLAGPRLSPGARQPR